MITNGTKNIILLLITVLLMSFFSLHAYVTYCSIRNKNVRFLKRFSIVKNIYMDKDFMEFSAKIADLNQEDSLRNAGKSRDETFESVWDFDNRIFLYKGMFNETNMYGKTKYKYKPNLKIMNIVAWTGLSLESLVFQLDAKTERLYKKIKVVHTSMTFETDKFGFKKTDFPNLEGSQAVVFLGDSFTEGLHIQPFKTFSNIFGIMMKDEGIQAIPVNMGVNGYSTLEMSWMLENYSKHFDVKMVIVNLFPNDVHKDYIAALTTDYPDGYTSMFYYLKKIKEFCLAHDIKLVISSIPPREQMTKMLIDGFFQERVSKWCNNEKVVFLNPLKYFREIGEKNIYFPRDPHFSNSGHKHYASYLFSHLQKEMEEK